MADLKPGRLLREQWTDPNRLAEELYVGLSAPSENTTPPAPNSTTASEVTRPRKRAAIAAATPPSKSQVAPQSSAHTSPRPKSSAPTADRARTTHSPHSAIGLISGVAEHYADQIYDSYFSAPPVNAASLHAHAAKQTYPTNPSHQPLPAQPQPSQVKHLPAVTPPTRQADPGRAQPDTSRAQSPRTPIIRPQAQASPVGPRLPTSHADTPPAHAVPASQVARAGLTSHSVSQTYQDTAPDAIPPFQPDLSTDNVHGFNYRPASKYHEEPETYPLVPWTYIPWADRGGVVGKTGSTGIPAATVSGSVASGYTLTPGTGSVAIYTFDYPSETWMYDHTENAANMSLSPVGNNAWVQLKTIQGVLMVDWEACTAT